MPGQMCWLSVLEPDGEKILHLRTYPSHPWRPYTSCPEYAVADYLIAGGSKGWATYQKLKCSGWTLVPSRVAQELTLLQVKG